MTMPAHKIRFGNLQVTIWRNAGENGTWYTAVPSRSFKTGDDAWKDSKQLRLDDLLMMSKLLDQAHTYIANQMKADAKARKEQMAA